MINTKKPIVGRRVWDYWASNAVWGISVEKSTTAQRNKNTHKNFSSPSWALAIFTVALPPPSFDVLDLLLKNKPVPSKGFIINFPFKFFMCSRWQWWHPWDKFWAREKCQKLKTEYELFSLVFSWWQGYTALFPWNNLSNRQGKVEEFSLT